MASRSGPRNPGHSARLNPGSLTAWRLRSRRGRLRSRRRHLGFSRSGWRDWTAGLGRDRFLRNLRHRGRRRRCRRIVGGLGQEALLGGRRPSPSEIGTDDVAGDTFGSYQRPHAAGEQDRRDDRRAAGSAGGATARCGRRHQGDAHEGDRPYVEQPPHSAPGNRLVDEARRRGERDDHQHGDAEALGPGRAAEEKPPQEDDQRADDSAHHRDGQNLEENDRHQPHDDEQHRNGHSRPEAERFARGGRGGLGDGHCGFACSQSARWLALPVTASPVASGAVARTMTREVRLKRRRGA